MDQHKTLSAELFRIDAGDWCGRIESFIRSEYLKSGRSGIVVPISGGLDSSVAAALCAKAIGRDKVLGLMLPESLGNPEANQFGRVLAAHLGIKTHKVNITPVLRGLGTSSLLLAALSGREKWVSLVNKILKWRNQTAAALYQAALTGKLDRRSRKMIAQVSSKQRARLLITYKIAEEQNLLVVGSSHRTEYLTGLFVKYGIDDGADLMPLKYIYRSHTLQLARELGLPDQIIQRPPNPDILPGITDKYLGYFGLDYLKVELILVGSQMKMTEKEISKEIGIAEELVHALLQASELSEVTRSHALAPDLDFNIAEK